VRFTPRQSSILHSLITAQEPVTGEQLARGLGVSARTIRKEIRSLSVQLQAAAIRIESTPGSGYSLPHESKTIAGTLLDLPAGQNYQPPVEAEQRLYRILQTLLLASSPVTMESLAEQLFVSRSTVAREVDRAEAWLELHALQLNRKPSAGIFISGEEFDHRCAILRLLITNASLPLQFESLQRYFPTFDLSELGGILDQLREAGGLLLSDSGYVYVLGYLAVALQRIPVGRIVRHPHVLRDLPAESSERAAAVQAAVEIQRITGCTFPDTEIDALAAVLRQADSFHLSDLCSADPDGTGTMSTPAAQGLVGMMQERYAIDLSGDSELLASLSLYLETRKQPGYSRMPSGPELREIGQAYPLALEMAAACSEWIAKRSGIPPDEGALAVIALYLSAALERRTARQRNKPYRVALICSTGTAGAQLLRAKFSGEFPQIEITGVYPSHRLQEALQSLPDFLVSTVPLPECAVPVLVVQHLLGDSDIHRVRKHLTGAAFARSASGRRVFLELFDEDLFLFDIHPKTREEVIRLLADLMAEKGCVDSSFPDAVLDREAQCSTAIGGGVAIPHALSRSDCGSQAAVGILRRDITWGQDRVRLVFLLNIRNEDHEEMKSIFDAFYAMLAEDHILRQLQKSRTFQGFLEILKSI